MLKMKTAFLLTCCLMFSGCLMNNYLDEAVKSDLKIVDNDSVSAIGQTNSENKRQTVILGNKNVYLIKNDEFNQFVSLISNGNYVMHSKDIDIELRQNNTAVSQGCFYVLDKDKFVNGKNKTHSFCHLSVEIYKKTDNIPKQYAIKSNININLKSKDKSKEVAISALRPFATIGDVVLFPAYILNPFMDWNKWWNR